MIENQETIEQWKDIPGYEGYYQASNLGNIKSLERFVKAKNASKGYIKKEIILSGGIAPEGYVIIVLTKNTIHKTFRAHQLIGITWLSNPENKREIHHKNAIRHDNRVENLIFVTKKENMQECVKMGRVKVPRFKGEQTGTSKLKEYQIREIRDFYSQKIFSCKDLSMKYSVHNSCIRKIINRESWAHII